jgi:acyl carrier protein phosphodiesterase
MNFLAHLYLSGDETDVMVGNFMADFVKGKIMAAHYPPGVQFGIELHRSIDAFTDRHPVVKTSKKRLWEKYRHYAGVIVDMYYDHFLSSKWNMFHDEPLPSYSVQVYQILDEQKSIMPDRLKGILPHMIRGNWLLGYGSIDGIGQALSGMSRRTPFDSKMDQATNDLRENYEAFQNEFLTFFPELREHANDMLKSHR